MSSQLDPRGLEAAAVAVGRHIHYSRLSHNCHRCRRTAESAVTAYLDVTQPIVETVEELEGLPVGTVVFCAKDYPLWLNRRTVQGWWDRPGYEEDFSDDEVPLPARVIWRPHETP